MVVHRGVSRWQIALYKGASVPTVESGPEVYLEVDGEEISYALDHVRFCVGDEDARPYLRALDCQQGRVRACDGAMYTHYDMQDKIDFSIPSQVVDAVRAYLKDFSTNATKEGIGFGETDNAYHFSTGVDSISVAKPSFEYPDLNTIIVRRVREQIPCVLKVSPLELSNALSHVAVVSDKNDTKLEITIQRDKLTLRCEKRGGTEAVTSLEAKWANPERKAYFDVKRFRDLLNSVSSGVEWEVKFGKDVRERKSPIVIEGNKTWTMLNQVRPL
jgi:DNA polymerase III sliding clamp (beta) subunit (PCNA family)